jgi:hypothetical protein
MYKVPCVVRIRAIKVPFKNLTGKMFSGTARMFYKWELTDCTKTRLLFMQYFYFYININTVSVQQRERRRNHAMSRLIYIFFFMKIELEF